METTGQIEWTQTIYFNGVYNSETSGGLNVAVGEPDHKISVDTGGFIPGIYRVNPYSIGRSWWANCVGDIETSIVMPYGVPTGWNYRYRQSGAVFLTAMNIANKKIPILNHVDVGAAALQKAYAKINAAQLPLGEDIGELGTTLKMLRNPLSGLKDFLSRNNNRNAKILYYLASGNRKAASRVPKWISRDVKNAGDVWLELRYGLRPLVMTAAKVFEMYAKQEEKLFNPNTIRSVRSKHVSTVRGNVSTGKVSEGVIYLDINASYEETKTGYAAVQYKQTIPIGTMAKFGLTPNYLPETVWQLTSLSFVVDWFFNVSAWLGQLRVEPSVTVLGNTVGIKRVRKVRAVETLIRGYHARSPWEASSQVAAPVYCEEEYDRSLNQALPMLPVFNWTTSLNFYKIVDGLFLIAQAFKLGGRAN